MTVSLTDGGMDTVPPISTFAYTFHGILGICLSNRCNIECRHCGTNSGPRERNVPDISTLLSHLDSLVSAGVVRALQISGGEPFLHKAELRLLCKLGHKYRIPIAVNTNAFWAHSRTAAEQLLSSFDGLSELFISASEYHQEYLPFERVRIAAESAISCGKYTTISFCTPHGIPNSFVTGVTEELGAFFLAGGKMHCLSLESGGRANALTEARWRPRVASAPIGSCIQINQPTVLENGDVVACRNTEVTARGNPYPLIFGNIHRDSLQDILAVTGRSRLVQVLRLFGPGYLFSLLSEEQRLEVSENLRQDDLCGLCVGILSRAHLAEYIYKALGTSRVDMLLDIGVAMQSSLQLKVSSGKVEL